MRARCRWAALQAALGCAALLVVAQPAAAGPRQLRPESSVAALQAAHSAFLAGDFAAAAAGYQSLVEAGGDSGWLYYNLGNSHLRTDNLGAAVMALLEAQARLPRAPEVRANLAWARGQAVDALAPPSPPVVWQVLAFWHFGLSLREIAWGAAMAQFAWCLLGAWACLTPSSGGRRAALVFCLSITAALGGSLAWRLAAPRELAVVTASEAQVHSAPHAEAVVRFRLHEGAEAWLGREEGDWAQITLGDGKRGWVTGAEIGRLRLR